jgi:hypothetical protein
MDVSVGCSTGTSLGYAPSSRVVLWRRPATGHSALVNPHHAHAECYLLLLTHLSSH